MITAHRSTFLFCFPYSILIYICCYSPDEPAVRLQHKVSASLKQALEKLKLTENAEETKGKS